MKGGSVLGHRGIRDYWTRQWGIIDPSVEPMRFTPTGDGRVDIVRHIYAFEDGLIKSMEIHGGEVGGL